MHVSRRAVQRVLTQHDDERQEGGAAPGPSATAPPAREPVDAYDDAIGGLLKRYPNITVVRTLLLDRSISAVLAKFSPFLWHIT
jgi:hypothetical protein